VVGCVAADGFAEQPSRMAGKFFYSDLLTEDVTVAKKKKAAKKSAKKKAKKKKR
jgi:hypothetical protein